MQHGDYHDLIVWQKAMELAVLIYRVTDDFPTVERFGLSNQMRRAAVSIPSNIAEGRRRGTLADYHHFLRIAFGSGAELETQLDLSMRLNFGTNKREKEAFELLKEIMKMLNTMLS